ncbi:MAG: hypothetical protein CMN60_20570 [Sphingobium sp.]|nr:hypothetical protein [Sphingobium sp.]MBS50041.1 hypothetical protein [Sphingobium sp.]|tara:strand:- start:36818 stop:37081 length:264 start_codon:yes stop_codon:yes gene_type:complete
MSVKKLAQEITDLHSRFADYNKKHPGRRFHIIRTGNSNRPQLHWIINEFGVYDSKSKKYILAYINHFDAPSAVEEMRELITSAEKEK